MITGNLLIISEKIDLSNPELTIEADPFQYTQAYQDYEAYRVLNRTIQSAISNDSTIDPLTITEIQNLNPEFWEVHYLVGQYYYEKGYFTAALNAFEMANTKEITTVPDEHEIDSYIKKLKRKLNL